MLKVVKRAMNATKTECGICGETMHTKYIEETELRKVAYCDCPKCGVYFLEDKQCGCIIFKVSEILCYRKKVIYEKLDSEFKKNDCIGRRTRT